MLIAAGFIMPTEQPSPDLTATPINEVALDPIELAEPEMVVAEQITPLETETDEGATEPTDLDEDAEDTDDFAEVAQPLPYEGPHSEEIQADIDRLMLAIPGLESDLARASFAALTDPKAKSAATKALKVLHTARDDLEMACASLPLAIEAEADYAEQVRVWKISVERAKLYKSRASELAEAAMHRSSLAGYREKMEATASALADHDAKRRKLALNLEVAQENLASAEGRVVQCMKRADALERQAIDTYPTPQQIKRQARKVREAERARLEEVAEQTRREFEALQREMEKTAARLAEEDYQNELVPTIKGWHEGKILHEHPKGNSTIDGICYSDDRGDMVARKDIPAWEAEQARLMTKYVGTGIKRRPNMFTVRGSAVGGAAVPQGFGEQPTAGEPLTYLSGERNNHGVSPTAEKQLKKIQGRAYVEPKEYSGENLVAPRHPNRRNLPGNMEHGTIEADGKHGWLHGYRFPMVAA
jgi:hypothetical protein